MVLKIDKLKDFTNIYLNNISKLSDSVVLAFDNNSSSALSSNTDNTIISFNSTIQKNKFVDTQIKFNIPDIKKFIKILSCINSENTNLEFESNNIKYSSSDYKFKYHLIEDGIISSPKINVDKISALTFNTIFCIDKAFLSNIVKASTVAADISKLYLYTEENSVFCDFTDNNRHNVDSIALKISENYDGDKIPTPVPVNFEIIRLLVTQKPTKISIKYNNKLGVFLFELEESNCVSKYIVSALVN
jgi:hypothetical protein